MEAAYDAIAEWYDTAVRAGSLIHDLVLPTIWDMIGSIDGQRICDLACGQGIVSRQLAMRGAVVTGVDISARLLDIARRDEDTDPLGIAYQQDDAQELGTLPDASVDGVVCNMALMDIPDVEATFRAVQRILQPAGWFVFSITHPCFQTPASHWIEDADGTISRAVRAYFAEGLWHSDNPTGVRGQVGAYHRTLATYIGALTAAALFVEHIREPRATGNIADQAPGYREIPAVLVARCHIGAGT